MAKRTSERFEQIYERRIYHTACFIDQTQEYADEKCRHDVARHKAEADILRKKVHQHQGAVSHETANLKMKILQAIDLFAKDDSTELEVNWSALWLTLGTVMKCETTINTVVAKHNAVLLSMKVFENKLADRERMLKVTEEENKKLRDRLDGIRRMSTGPF